ncbi:MAG: hypothetical protein L0Y43_04890 [Methylococcaceae bacterium]|nr:hypothetical protein [Methylococcaceae bacterium]
MNDNIDRPSAYIALALALLMAATRSHHFAAATYLPDASWAVFFLAGFYLRTLWAFAALLVLAGASDYVSINWFGVSDFCISPAYGFLLPAYGTLWLAGRWYARRHRFALATLMPLAGVVLAGAVLCEVFSSGGFYFFSGRFPEPDLLTFAGRFTLYFPPLLMTMGFYVALAALVHAVLESLRGRGTRHDQERALKAR